MRTSLRHVIAKSLWCVDGWVEWVHVGLIRVRSGGIRPSLFLYFFLFLFFLFPAFCRKIRPCFCPRIHSTLAH